MRKLGLAFCFLLSLAGCAEEGSQPHLLNLSLTSFSNINGWNEDNQLAAIATLARSCPRLIAKADTVIGSVPLKQESWKDVCSHLQLQHFANDDEARVFLTTYFNAYAAKSSQDPKGLFTGYYEAELDGSLVPSPRFNVPLYARPHDLINVDLGKFKTNLKGGKHCRKSKRDRTRSL